MVPSRELPIVLDFRREQTSTKDAYSSRRIFLCRNPYGQEKFPRPASLLRCLGHECRYWMTVAWRQLKHPVRSRLARDPKMTQLKSFHANHGYCTDGCYRSWVYPTL